VGFLDAFKAGEEDAIRQSTSLTMAYLLAQNGKFEAYMRSKVEELEARVAAQQARWTGDDLEVAWDDAMTVDVEGEGLLEERSVDAEDEAAEIAVDEKPASPFAEEEWEPAGEPPSWQAMLLEADSACEVATDGTGETMDGTLAARTDDPRPADFPAEAADIVSPAEASPASGRQGPNGRGCDVQSLLPDWGAVVGDSRQRTGRPAVAETVKTAGAEEMVPSGSAGEEGEDDEAWASPLNQGPAEVWA
jgi:hypothetical protein